MFILIFNANEEGKYAKWAVILVLDSISINIGIGILLLFILIEANEEGKYAKWALIFTPLLLLPGWY